MVEKAEQTEQEGGAVEGRATQAKADSGGGAGLRWAPDAAQAPGKTPASGGPTAKPARGDAVEGRARPLPGATERGAPPGSCAPPGGCSPQPAEAPGKYCKVAAGHEREVTNRQG